MENISTKPPLSYHEMVKQNAFLSITLALLVPLSVHAQNTIILRSIGATSFTAVTGVNPQGRPLGTFRVKRLVLSVNDFESPEDYDIELTRLNAHFPYARLTPSNSRVNVIYSRATRGEKCYLIVNVTPNNRPTSRFTYFGEIDYRACTDVVTVRGVRVRSGIQFIDGAIFDFATQRDVAGTFTRVDISRERFEDAPSASLVRV